MKRIIYLAIALGTTFPLLNSCRESALEPTLAQDKPVEGNVNTAEALRGILNGAYDKMAETNYYGRDIIVLNEVRTDNAFSAGKTGRFREVGQLNTINTTLEISGFWSKAYEVIVNANVVINANASGDQATINHYKGEAYALRALAHFDLLRIYGQQNVDGGGMLALGVPYVKNYGEKISPKRNTVQEVYDNAMADLDQAISLLSASKDDKTKHYITTNAAKAIKARIALYFKKYDIAKKYAKEVIDSGKYSVATSKAFADTFTTDSTANQIFSIANSGIDNRNINSLASIYTETSENSYGDIEFLKDLYSKYETGDVRRKLFAVSGSAINKANPERYRCIKYTDTSAIGSYDISVIRYEEVVLIYAEALLQTGDSATALTYLNQIASNRGATKYSSATLDNILLERRKEFAGEGFRFDDLMRAEKALPIVDATLQKYGRGTSKSEAVPYGDPKLGIPIPLTELKANPNIKQNKGY